MAQTATIVDGIPLLFGSHTKKLERMSRRRHQRRPDNISTAGEFHLRVLQSDVTH
jgi:hypothetical protein